jgi:peptidoglycan/LPS O-acetylase OafA/YrhL
MTGVRGWSLLDGRDNALNTVRLGLALLVIFGHTWAVLGIADKPLPYAASFAVNGFFVISGFLIARSRDRLALGEFLWRRALRILPGFWVTLLLTAAVLAPLAALLTGARFDPGSAAGYVTANATTHISQMGIADTLAGAPYPTVWNGSLWTIWYECLAYIVTGLVMTLPRFGLKSAAALHVVTLLVVLGQGSGVGAGVDPWFAMLFAFFTAGMVAHYVLDRIPTSGGVAAACALFLAAGPAMGSLWWFLLAPLPLTYLMLWLGARLPIRAGARNDISFGVYLHAYPLQQLLVVVGAGGLGPWWMLVLAVAATAPIAWASWLFVERPALRWRTRSELTPAS